MVGVKWQQIAEWLAANRQIVEWLAANSGTKPFTNVEHPAGAFNFEEMTSPDLLDIHFVIFDDVDLYLNQISIKSMNYISGGAKISSP